MRRVLVLTAAGLSLAGCSSFSMDAFKSAPEPVTVQFESTPPGAEAKTSVGPACTTPCSLPIVTEGNFEDAPRELGQCIAKVTRRGVELSVQLVGLLQWPITWAATN